MSRKLTLSTIAAACALCLSLAACGGSSSGESATSSDTSSPAAESSSEATASEESAEVDNHNSYFVGKWDLYESDEYTHDQVEQVRDLYANDEDYRNQLKEAFGRDDEIEFCARFNADGTGQIDTGAEIVPFTWEATNEGAITFLSFGGDETALHLPVTDGMFTLNGDTYAKAE